MDLAAPRRQHPGARALAELLAAAEADPDAAVLGPKLREWPSLRRLLEVGVTISGTGRRETGLERSEYDQGQHDDVRRVLAVNTAGMLVRRELLRELGGFDRHLPIFGNDVDFGWRAAAAGHRTIVVPQAVVFHAEAAHRGSRRTPLTGRHTHYQERRAALWTLLVNGRARSLPWRLLRLAGGTLVRMIGFLLVRSVGEALDELAALLSVYSRPGQLLAARRERRRLRTDPDGAAALLSPWWVPYRHGLDFVSDLAAALTNQAPDVAERRRAAALAQAAAEAAAGPAHSAARTTRPSAGRATATRTTTCSSPTPACSPACSPALSRWPSRSSWSPCSPAPARRGGRSREAHCRRRPRPRRTGGVSTSRAGTRSRSAPTCPRRPTCSRSLSWPACSAEVPRLR